MKKVFLLFAGCSVLLFFAGCKFFYTPTDIRLLTEEYEPLNFTQNSKPAGLAVDIVNALLARMHQTGAIEVMDWESAYGLAQAGPKTAIFSMALTAERKDLFKWVGPLATFETRFYAAADSALTIDSMEAAKAVAKIVTVKDYYTDQMLKDAGFTNLEVCDNEDQAIQKLLAGQADLFPSNNIAIGPLLERNGMAANKVKNVFQISMDLVYIGFSKDIPDETVQQWQSALDALKGSFAFKAGYKKWLPGETPPGILQLMTEQYPPITFMQDGRVTGLATEMVRAIIKRRHIPDNIRLTTWGSAYNMALINPNVVLFSTERTELREDLFNWVGPIGRNVVSFYAKKGSGISIASLEEAKDMKIATTTGWFSEQLLIDAGFTNLLSSPEPTANVQQLMDGQAQLAVFTDLTVKEIVEAAGYVMEDLEPVFTIKTTDFYIALSLGTAPSTVAGWEQTLEAIKDDGTFARIYKKFAPNADISDLLAE